MKKLIIWMLILVLLVSAVQAWTEQQVCYDAAPSQQQIIGRTPAGNHYLLATNFTVNESKTLINISTRIASASNPAPSGLRAELRSDDGAGEPSSTILSFGNISNSSIIIGWNNITLETGYMVNPGTSYWIVWTTSQMGGASGEYYEIYGSAPAGTCAPSYTDQDINAVYNPNTWGNPWAAADFLLVLHFLEGTSTTTTDLKLTASDAWNGTLINNFAVNITWANGTIQQEGTANGTIYLDNSTYQQNTTINITFWNVTSYYNFTHLDRSIEANTTNNIKAEMFQSVLILSANKKISGGAIIGTFESSNKITSSRFNITEGIHNITFYKTGWYNSSEIFITTNKTTHTESIDTIHSSEWNLSIYNLITGDLITNYSLNIISYNYPVWIGENSTTTTGSYIFDAINGTYQVEIDAPGYAIHVFNFTINKSLGGANFSLYTTNSINFSFYDEETKNLLSGYNISIELIGEVDAYNYTTNTGYLYVDLIAPQSYTIRYDDLNDTYGERFYYFNLTNRSNNAIDLYLLNNGTEGYSTITCTVYDGTNFFVEGAIIKALRYYIDTNSYIVVDVGKTNFEGVATINLKKNEEFYKFIIEYPMGTTKKITEPTQIYADTLNFQILLGSATGERWYKSVETIADITFDETNNWFRLEWNDAQNTISRMCMQTDLMTQFRNQTVNYTCSTSAAGIMYHKVNNISGYTYKSTALAFYSDPPAPVASKYHTFLANNPIGMIGLFALLIVTIAFMLTGVWNIAVAVVLTPLPTMLASIAGIVQIPVYVSVPIQIVAIIVAYIISTRA